jgi:hypothetical protein
MITDIDIFKKIKESCSNIFLIDENLCLSNSYQIINYNIQSLSSALISLQPTIDYFNQEYTYFTQNSAKFIEVNSNLKLKTKKLNDVYTLTLNNSSSFNKPISVFYNVPINISEWNTNINSNPVYYQNFFKSWLSLYYPTVNFPNNQRIILNVNLYVEQEFNLANNQNSGDPSSTDINLGFYRQHLEECKPEKGQAVTVSCGSGSCGIPNRGCNHHSKNQNYCFNAYEKCGKGVSGGGQPQHGNCGGTGSSLLKISDNYMTKDRYTSTSINFLYQNINSIWNYQNILT